MKKMNLSDTDSQELIYAKTLLENPGLGVILLDIFGIPIEQGLHLLPEKWFRYIMKTSRNALYSALNVALSTLGNKERKSYSDMLHKIAAAGTGCAGGLFGLPALPIELPISTTIMLRSVADIARSQGEELDSIESKLACIEVFALGSGPEREEGAETGYYSVRAALSKAITDASVYLAEHGMAESGAPALVRLVSEITTRFGIVVSERTAVSAIPIIGAAGGAVINEIFINHFQQMAYGHFIIRRLEREYGKEAVRAAYMKTRTWDAEKKRRYTPWKLFQSRA